MSITAHVEQLEQRHQIFESELAALITRPSASDEELAEVKRRKLKLKDEIAPLKAAN